MNVIHTIIIKSSKSWESCLIMRFCSKRCSSNNNCWWKRKFQKIYKIKNWLIIMKKKIDFYVFFFLHTWIENMTDIDDLFFSRNIRTNLINMLIWQMLQKIIYVKFSSYISMKFSMIEIISKINVSEHILRKIILLKWKILTSVKARW